MNLGIDLGTSRVSVCQTGRGIVLDEPTVIALDARNDRVIACGAEAEEMLGREPASIRVVRPVHQGVIAEYEQAERMLRIFLRKVCSNRITKPCIAVGISEEVTEVEKRSFIEAVVSAGARRVTLVPQTVAAAIGAGMDVTESRGRMVVNMGAGIADAAVLSLQGIATVATTRTAGDAMDEAIIRYMRAVYGLVVGRRVAEQTKQTVGCAVAMPETVSVAIKGRDALTGLPRVQTVTGAEITEALQEPLEAIGGMVHRVLESTPPELAGDVMTDGICLTGGLAQLRGMEEYLYRRTGVACHTAEDPAHCVVRGSAEALRHPDGFLRVYDLGDYAYRLSDSLTN